MAAIPPEKATMPRYMIERTFPDGIHVPVSDEGVSILASVVAANHSQNVTWLHSCVSADKQKSFCLYDGQSRIDLAGSGEQGPASRPGHPGVRPRSLSLPVTQRDPHRRAWPRLDHARDWVPPAKEIS